MIRTCFVQNIRSISTASFRCTANEAVAKKQDYYKNISDVQKEANTKPAGWDEAKPFESIPGPKPLPLIGNAYRFLPIVGEYHGKDLVDLSKGLNDQYGEIVSVRNLMGSFNNLVFLYSPEHIEQLFRNDGIWPVRLGSAGFSYYRRNIRNDVFDGSYGVLITQGEEWFKARSIINPILMQPRSALMSINKINSVASELVDNIRYFAKNNPKREMPDDFSNELNKWSLESIGVVALDTRMGCLKRDLKPDSPEQIYINHVNELFDLFYKIEVLPNLWRLLNTPTWKRYVEVNDYVTFANLKFVENAKLEGDGSQKDESELSMIQRLIKIDKKVAMTMAIDMLQAGVDTTSKSLAIAMYHLAKNPAAQESLRKETIELLPNRDSPVTTDVLKNASYVKAVIKEAARIEPVIAGTARNLCKDLVIGGYQIPKGTDVITGNLIISRSEKYVPRPREFIPERWLRTTSGELSHKNMHPFVTLPFGFGQRSCVGQRVAMMEMETALLKIIRNFKLSWPHGDAIYKTTILHGIASPLKFHVEEVDA